MPCDKEHFAMIKTVINLAIIIVAFCSALVSGSVLASKSNDSGGLKPFVSDGCSAFPDGTLRHKALWLSCCHQHDFDYWKGGTHQQRLASDNALEACVAKVGEPEIAKLMLLGVRVGGSPYLPTEFRWGYGWPYPRLYGALSRDEVKQVEALGITSR